MKPASWIGLITLLLAAACAAPQPQPQPPGPTATPTVTASPTASPTATVTPSPTPTPTPTAVPISIADNLRAQRQTTPVPQRNAPCGVVDFFDFPLAAPDGEGAGARWLFGRYSSRYQGIHAGEDWVYDGGDSLGQPVYAVAHGRVLYAQPLGWGVDQGVIIVRHVFTDGTFINSFYGHLDPPSVLLNPGDCVARGEQIGAIGKPRGRPHLHFEIRSHLPTTPGPGYWSVDPKLAGWEPPSDFIWNDRISTAPGIQWTRVFTSFNAAGLGLLQTDRFAAYDNGQLFAVDPASGALSWTLPITAPFRQGTLDVNRQLIYLSTFSGTLQAINADGQPQWLLDFGEGTRLKALPRPGGGVLAHLNNRLIAFSREADRAWEIDRVGEPADWLLTDQRVIFSTDTATYALDQAGQLTLLAPVAGQVAVARGQVYVYNPSGVYGAADGVATLIKPLDNTWRVTGDFVSAADGTLLIVHRSSIDRRLIALNADGSLRWDRSIEALGSLNGPLLTTLGNKVYAVASDGDVLDIDLATGDARRVFDGGSGSFLSGQAWVSALPADRLLFDFRGGRLIAFEPGRVPQ